MEGGTFSMMSRQMYQPFAAILVPGRAHLHRHVDACPQLRYAKDLVMYYAQALTSERESY